MTQAKTIYAFTPPGGNPPYMNISELEDGTLRVTVRGPQQEIITDAMRGSTSIVQHSGWIDLPNKNELVNLFLDLGSHLYGENVMAVTGKVIFQLLTEAKASVDAAADNAVAIAEDLTDGMEGSAEYHNAHDTLMQDLARGPEGE